jgi:predicted SprT family Zn-dependent metalloprotease
MIPPRLLEQETERAYREVADVLGIDPWPEVPVRWNRRLRRAGRAIIDKPERGIERAVIELSPAYFAVYPEDLYGILVHEAVHVGLAILDLPFGHGPEFKHACEAAGGLLHGRWLPGRVFIYRCPVCRAELERRRPAAGWCASCAEDASGQGLDPYGEGRALVLVATQFRGPEPAPDPAGVDDDSL